MTSNHTYVLITGANTGLGFGICHRLIDEFLATRTEPAELTLVFTTRSSKKGSDTLKALRAHLAKYGLPGQGLSRIHLRSENVELTDLLSVKALAAKLIDDGDIPKLNAIILNAGIASVTGIDWPAATWQILTEHSSAVTWPRFKLSAVGSVTERQLPNGEGKDAETEPPLGQVFCANVLGHYMLTHWLMPLLRSCGEGSKGRVIWISSIEAGDQHFDEENIQGINSRTAYEHSKRLTDLLALTASGQSATEASVAQFVSIPGAGRGEGIGPRPEIVVAHPGIVTTSIVPLPPMLMSLWVATAYVMRWLGSPWHTNTAFNGAVSATWLALATPEEVEGRQASGMVKWGSAVGRSGNARVEETDVPGWGVNGSGKSVKDSWWGGRWGRIIGVTDATEEDVEDFVQQGARVWREMEVLRLAWEERIERYQKGTKSNR